VRQTYHVSREVTAHRGEEQDSAGLRSIGERNGARRRRPLILLDAGLLGGALAR
jgi:hypothetical protein